MPSAVPPPLTRAGSRVGVACIDDGPAVTTIIITTSTRNTPMWIGVIFCRSVLSSAAGIDQPTLAGLVALMFGIRERTGSGRATIGAGAAVGAGAGAGAATATGCAIAVAVCW